MWMFEYAFGGFLLNEVAGWQIVEDYANGRKSGLIYLKGGQTMVLDEDSTLRLRNDMLRLGYSVTPGPQSESLPRDVPVAGKPSLQ